MSEVVLGYGLLQWDVSSQWNPGDGWELICSKGRATQPILVGWQCRSLMVSADIVTCQRWAMWRGCRRTTDIVGRHLGSLFYCRPTGRHVRPCVRGADIAVWQVVLYFGWCWVLVLFVGRHVCPSVRGAVIALRQVVLYFWLMLGVGPFCRPTMSAVAKMMTNIVSRQVVWCNPTSDRHYLTPSWHFCDSKTVCGCPDGVTYVVCCVCISCLPHKHCSLWKMRNAYFVFLWDCM